MGYTAAVELRNAVYAWYHIVGFNVPLDT